MPQAAFPAGPDSPNPRLCSPLVLLSQGEVRPGVKQGQHWGRPLPSPLPPVRSLNFFTEIR